MTIQETATILYKLHAAYKSDAKTTSKEMTDRVQLWAAAFKDEPYALIDRAVMHHINTNSFYPSLKEIRDSIRRERLADIPERRPRLKSGNDWPDWKIEELCKWLDFGYEVHQPNYFETGVKPKGLEAIK